MCHIVIDTTNVTYHIVCHTTNVTYRIVCHIEAAISLLFHQMQPVSNHLFPSPECYYSCLGQRPHLKIQPCCDSIKRGGVQCPKLAAPVHLQSEPAFSTGGQWMVVEGSSAAGVDMKQTALHFVFLLFPCQITTMLARYEPGMSIGEEKGRKWLSKKE